MNEKEKKSAGGKEMKGRERMEGSYTSPLEMWKKGVNTRRKMRQWKKENGKRWQGENEVQRDECL